MASPAPAGPTVGIDLTKYTDQLHEAFAAGRLCVLASADKNGVVDAGVKGSLFVFDKDHLAYLERTHGRHLSNVRENPHVAITFFNRDATPAYMRFFGEAQAHDSGPLRDEIRNRTIPQEQARDPENKGIGVLVRINRVIEAGGKSFVRG